MIFQKYLNDLRWTIKKFRDIFNKYIELLEGWTKFFEIYDYTPKVVSKKDLKPEKIKGEIEFDNVKFSYPLKPNVIILNHLSFKIQPGKVLAIVGHSGSGKSTILNLIQRFYDPEEGIIKLDGIDIRDLNINWYHKNIGLVSQEPILNNSTIEDNIIYGVKEYSEKYFNEVCELSCVNEFVKDKNQFPGNFKTIVGERGVQVSGGQKQRIAIARALMKNVKILIFDEATSALDAQSENDVQSAINNIIKKKNITSVIIAHRLSTIRNADTIVFLDNGRIVESGTHDELIKLNGEYKKLVEKQLVS
jgi:ABC-type multidrug transport system fused ATPase/permease subunit